MAKLHKWDGSGPTAFDSRANYGGPDMSEYYVGPMRVPNQAGPLEDSNWYTVLKMLGPEEEGSVEVHSFGHWAWGSYDQVLVHKGDAYAVAVLQELADMLEDYPVLDETDYSNREFEAITALWISMSLRERMEMCVECGFSKFAARYREGQDYDIPDMVWERLSVWVSE